MPRKTASLLIILILVLSLVVGFLWLEIRSARQLRLLTVFSKQYSIVAGGIDWRLNNFQPVVKGFLEEDRKNYVLAGFTDQNNQLREVKLFVSGKTPNDYQIETIVLQAVGGIGIGTPTRRRFLPFIGSGQGYCLGWGNPGKLVPMY